MGLARILGLCLAFLFATSVGAVTIDLGPSDYRSFGSNGSHTAAGIRSGIGQTVRIPPSNGSLVVTRNPVIPYGSVANGLRNFVRINPASAAASAAITALFLGLDWVFDEELDSWMKEGLQPDPSLGDFYWYTSAQSDIHYSDPVELCVARTPGPVQEAYALRTYEFKQFTPGSTATRGNCEYNVYRTYQGETGAPTLYNMTVYRGGSQCNPPAAYYPDLGMCALPGVIPLDASDWIQLESSLPASAPGTVAEAAGDAQRKIGNPLPGYQDTTITGPSSFAGPETTSTTVDPVTGDTTITTTSTTTNINYGDTTITTTNTSTTNTYQNGQQTSSTTTTETPGGLPVADGGGGVGDWPGFCDWATVVCDWLLWTQEDPPPEQDLPSVLDEDFGEEKIISFGAKVCPPDYQISLAPFLSEPVGVSFQPLCDFAALIYYMVMAASYIIAAYISIGVARSA